MARTTKEQAESALRVYKNTAKRLGLDYSGFDFLRYPSGYSLTKTGGDWLLIRGQRSLTQWYDILNAADEALKAVENLQITEFELL